MASSRTVIKGGCFIHSPVKCVREILMMVCSTVLTLLVLLVTVHECGAAHHYYVTATNGSDCPPTFPCHPLNYYVQNAASYFTSNTVVEFLPGLHELNYTRHIFILFVRNLSLIGSNFQTNTSTKCSHSDSVVFCTGYAGFLFGMVNDLKIMNLHVTHCGAVLYPKSFPKLPFIDTGFLKVYIALLMFYVQNLVISRVTVEKSYGFGVFAVNIWNRSVITDSCFISNNEYVGKYQRCIDPDYLATCTGGNLRLTYLDLILLPGTPANSSLEINNSEFRYGVFTIQPGSKLGFAGGLETIVGAFRHDIYITINNSVIAENSGFVGGNMYIIIKTSVKLIAIRLDRCHIDFGKRTEASDPLLPLSTGLTCLITHFKDNIVHVHISNTKFTSNYDGAVTLFVGGRHTYTRNNSTYMILVDGCEFSSNSAHFSHTGLMAAMMFEMHSSKITVHKNVLNVRIVIQNSTFHHNFKLQNFSQQNGDLIQFYQLPKLKLSIPHFIATLVHVPCFGPNLKSYFVAK